MIISNEEILAIWNSKSFRLKGLRDVYTVLFLIVKKDKNYNDACELVRQSRGLEPGSGTIRNSCTRFLVGTGQGKGYFLESIKNEKIISDLRKFGLSEIELENFKSLVENK